MFCLRLRARSLCSEPRRAVRGWKTARFFLRVVSSGSSDRARRHQHSKRGAERETGLERGSGEEINYVVDVVKHTVLVAVVLLV